MTGMTRRRGRPCAWPPARGVCGVPPPLKPPFEIGDPLEVMNSMYTDRNKTEVRRTVAPWATGSPSAEDDVRTTSRIPREPKRYAHFLRADAHLCRRRVEPRASMRAAGAQVGAPTAFDQKSDALAIRQ